jgi:hypothetical protein
MRRIKPANYIEVGSGLSTYYSSVARERNEAEGQACHITCIEPYPYPQLHALQGNEVIAKEVQDVDVSFFETLKEGDVLFIDSTHIVKIDGDVPYLFLEVIPRLKKGVIIHIHDIPFPYNVPYPFDMYIFGKERPWYFTEPMFLQALLCDSDSYDILMSLPLIAHADEEFLLNNVPGYRPLKTYNVDTAEEIGFPPCSIWIEKNSNMRAQT